MTPELIEGILAGLATPSIPVYRSSNKIDSNGFGRRILEQITLEYQTTLDAGRKTNTFIETSIQGGRGTL